MQSPSISVVIPCFNASATLVAAVDSVFAQDIEAEIILIDDGSSDDTLNLIQQLIAKFGNRIIGVSQSNQGPAAARNRGIQLAQGTYICFLDADDQYNPGFFSRAKAVLDSQAHVVAVESTVELTHTDRTPEPWQLQAMAATMLGTLMVRTEIVRLMDGFPIDAAFRGKIGGEDGCFRLVLPSFGEVQKIDFVGLAYRLRPSSHTELFLNRARLENARVVFDYQSPEELDGSFGLAIQRYRDAIGSRMIDRACDDIASKVTAVANCEVVRSRLLRKPAEQAIVEGFTMYALARFWPVGGDVLEVAPSAAFQSTAWLNDACRASRNGTVVSDRTPRQQPFRAVVANVASMPIADAVRIAEPLLPLGGLLVIYSDTDPLPTEIATGSTVQWKDRMRSAYLRAMEKRS